MRAKGKQLKAVFPIFCLVWEGAVCSQYLLVPVSRPVAGQHGRVGDVAVDPRGRRPERVEEA